MKKALALFLALVMCLSLVACGGNTASNQGEPKQQQPTTSEYTIGESFGTDNVECTVTEIKWVTPEEFDSVAERTVSTVNGESVYRIDTDILFPSCDPFGALGGVKSKISDQYFLLVSFTLQNTGKEIVKAGEERLSAYDSILLPYGTFAIIYDDEYTFDLGEKVGFYSTLDVLGGAIMTVGGCKVPKQVFENEDKPLKIKVSLPNAAGEVEDFVVSVR